MYLKKGGNVRNWCGRKCLCNALMANIGLGQVRRSGYVEHGGRHGSARISRGARRLGAEYPVYGWTAKQAVDWLLSALPQ